MSKLIGASILHIGIATLSRHTGAIRKETTEMNLLTDISIEHTYKGKGATIPMKYVMHPFENTSGDHSGRFEVIRTWSDGGKEKKRSAHLTKAELAEMFARGFHEQFDIRLRLRPADGCYPAAPPGKKVSSRCIALGSDFDRLVGSLDSNTPVSFGLREQLSRLSLAV